MNYLFFFFFLKTNNVTSKETPTTDIDITAAKIAASLYFRNTLLSIPFGKTGSISGKLDPYQGR